MNVSQIHSKIARRQPLTLAEQKYLWAVALTCAQTSVIDSNQPTPPTIRDVLATQKKLKAGSEFLRDAFESWYMKDERTCNGENLLLQSTDGQYINPDTHSSWLAWCAALEANVGQPNRVSENILDLVDHYQGVTTDAHDMLVEVDRGTVKVMDCGRTLCQIQHYNAEYWIAGGVHMNEESAVNYVNNALTEYLRLGPSFVQ